MSQQVDPRGQRVAAAVTSAILAAVLLLAPRPLGLALLAAQTALFAVAVLRGVQRTPLAALYRSAVRPRLGPPGHWEDPEPPRFAQGVGLGFALASLLGFLTGAHILGYVALAAALVAALLNATIGLCLGCEVYLLARRVLTTPDRPQFPATETRITT